MCMFSQYYTVLDWAEVEHLWALTWESSRQAMYLTNYVHITYMYITSIHTCTCTSNYIYKLIQVLVIPLCTQYEKEGIVDPLKYMCEMRQDRGGIIQTPVSQ